MRHRIRNLLCAVLLIASPMAGGCDRHAAKGEGLVVRDSAGVRISENAGPGWSSDEQWQLSSDAILSIGAADGSDPYLFHGVLGVRRLTDGRFVVANRATSELRFFDANGRFLGASGREGDGPGEFRFMSLFWLHASDTLVVSDMRGLTVVDSQGRYNRLVTLQPASGRRAQPIGQLADGTLLATTSTGAGFPPTPGVLVRDSIQFHTFGSDGSPGVALTTMPGAEVLVVQSGQRVVPHRVPFAAHPAWAAAHERFYLTSAREPQLSVWRPDGTLEKIIRWPELPAITPGQIARYREHVVATARTEDARRQQEQFLSLVTMPERLPTTGELYAIVVADDEHLWVEAYRPPWVDQPEWLIFSPDGAWLGSVRVPLNFSLQQVAGNSVIGSWRDESGVEYVRIYNLTRGTGGRQESSAHNDALKLSSR